METDYYETYFINVRNNICAGLSVPGLKNSGMGFHLYCLLLMSIDLVIFLLFAIQMLQMNTIIRICIDFIGDCTVLYGLVISMYLAKVTRPFKELLKKFDRVTLACLNDPLDLDKSFHKRFISDYKYIRLYSLISVPFIACSSIGFFALNIIRGSGIFGMDGKKIISVDIWIPNTDKSPNFEISQLMGMAGIMISACQKQAMDCFILSLLALLTTFLDHLNLTISNVFSDNFKCEFNQNNSRCCYVYKTKILKEAASKSKTSTTPEENEDNFKCLGKCVEIKLKSWVIIHQKTLSLGRELIDLLSPLLAFYLVNIIALVAVTVFTVTLGEIAFMEFVCLTYYSLTTGLTLYLLCNYGNQLILKGTEAAQPAFWKSFQLDEKPSKAVLSSLRIIFQRTMNPLVVSPFRSASFELSQISFVSFVKSIISFYFAIKKIKEVSN